MRKLITLAATVALVLTLFMVAPVSAKVTHSTNEGTYVIDVCGMSIFGPGVQDGVLKTTEDKAGGLHFLDHTRFDFVSDDGAYAAHSTSHRNFSTKGAYPLATSITLNYTVHGPDHTKYRVKQTAHLTINANGDTTVSFDKQLSAFDCP